MIPARRLNRRLLPLALWLAVGIFFLWLARPTNARPVDPECWWDGSTLHAENLPDEWSLTTELYPVGVTPQPPTFDGTFAEPFTAYFWQRGGGKSLVKAGPQLSDYHVVCIAPPLALTAAHPASVAGVTFSGKEVVEQQSTGWQGQPDPCSLPNVVCNRTGCSWDVDDMVEIRFVGRGEAEWSRCLVTDYSTHLLSMDGGTVTVDGVTARCIVGPTWSSSADLPPIPGGGVGVVTTVTWNYSGSKPRSLGFGRLTPDFSDWVDLCPSGWPWTSWERVGRMWVDF